MLGSECAALIRLNSAQEAEAFVRVFNGTRIDPEPGSSAERLVASQRQPLEVG